MSIHRIALLLPAMAVIAVAAPAPEGARPGPETVREAATRALQSITRTWAGWKIPCGSCHHQALPLVALGEARRRGIHLNPTLVHDHAAKTMGVLSSVPAALTMPLDTFGEAYSLLAFEFQGVRPNPAVSAHARKVALLQFEAGNWPNNDGRLPAAGSDFGATALLARGAAHYLPPEMSAQRDRMLERARKWLVENPAHNVDDSAYRLLGLAWTGASAAERQKAAMSLLEQQSAGGGWSQVPQMVPDAYATGLVLYALRESGQVEADHAAFQRGLRFLLSTQAPDGTWHVRTRIHTPSMISPPYFESGFPYGKDQYISCSATAWAAMALLQALPLAAIQEAPLPLPELEAKNPASWLHTALFGSVDQLRALLDAGLDPNAAWEGVTVLDAAVPDFEKARLLLERGAKPGRSLAVAVSYRGAGKVAALLLDHGADLQCKGTRRSETPIYAAIGAGDIAVVDLLVRRGASLADPAAGEEDDAPLRAGLETGSPELIRYLIRKGHPNLERPDRAGLTPLMFAALFHRTGIVEVLLEAGANPATVDSFGYTALRHSADIQYSDPSTAAALEKLVKRSAARTRPAP